MDRVEFPLEAEKGFCKICKGRPVPVIAPTNLFCSMTCLIVDFLRKVRAK